MGDTEQKLKTVNEMHESPCRTEVKNMILEAKLDVAKWKITFLLALLALLGVILPFILSLRSESRVNDAISFMEKRFNEIVGKQLQKPEIVCKGLNNELLQNSVFQKSISLNAIDCINILNQGDGLAGPIDAYIYFKDDKKLLESDVFDYYGWRKRYSEDKNYTIKYFIGSCDHISPHDIFPIPVRIDNFYFPSDSDTYQIPALLKVYYGEPEPISVPFTFRLIK
ncbi:MAG: hypothetical protein A2Y10_04435 [Planctomycetes bacterium GWF2_41_51]|nr:MAG: hypothetical protein A2Y10_04435 [Planctomycetes bacterium GWF2_41_51]HBG27033.1 hypothetical protein [Phycisphaerales bacterium]